MTHLARPFIMTLVFLYSVCSFQYHQCNPTRGGICESTLCQTRDYSLLFSGQSEDDSTIQEIPNRSLEELLMPSKECRVDQMSGTDLGEMYTRNHARIIPRPEGISDLLPLLT